MNETFLPAPPPPKGYSLTIDRDTAPEISLFKGDAIYIHGAPELGWSFINEDNLKIHPKSAVSIAVLQPEPVPSPPLKASTPPTHFGRGYEYFLPEVGVTYRGDFVIRSDTHTERVETFLLLSEADAYRKEYFRKVAHSESVLQEAERLINGDRQQAYGSAAESFERIAAFWHAYLKHKLKDTEHIEPKDVAAMMILMKVSRSVTSSKRDNWVDAAAYAELGSQLDTQE